MSCKQDQTESVPMLADKGWFLFKSQSQVRGAERTLAEHPLPALGWGRGAAGDSYLMQDVLIEVTASSPLVGIQSLLVHARRGAQGFSPSLRSASALPGSAGCGRLGSSPAGRAAPGFSTGQLPRRRREWRVGWGAGRPLPSATFQHQEQRHVPLRLGPEFRDPVRSESPVL